MHIVVDDAKLDVTTAGAGDAIVLLHGFPFSHEIWNSQIERLAATHFVVAPDLRGLGKSQVTDGPYLMESLAGDIAGVMDALGVRTATMAGHSLGGYVALAFFRMFSERVARLALICSRIVADTQTAARARLELADRAESDAGIAPVVEFYESKVFAPETPAEVRERALQMIRQTDPRGAAAMLRGMAMRVPSDDLLEEIKVPLLIVTGGKDRIVTADEWSPLIRGVADARIEICERSGHLPMVEEPERLSDIVASFAAAAN